MRDDPTKNLPAGAGHYDTKPTIETVLERINALGENLGGKIDHVRDGLSGEIQSLRSEMNQQFAKVAEQFTFFNRKVDILTREIMNVKTRQELADDRLDKLEEKTS